MSDVTANNLGPVAAKILMSDVTANNLGPVAAKILMSDVTANNRCSAQTNSALSTKM